MNIFKYLAFLPSITFGLFKKVEIFPWASLFIFSNKNFSFLVSNYLFFFFYISFSSMYSIFYATNNDLDQNIFFETFRSILAYLNPIIIFTYLLSCNSHEYKVFLRIAIKIFIFFIFLSIVQFIGFLENYNNILNFFVPRSSFLSEGIGGARLLSSEPSRSSVEFFFLYIIVFLILHFNNKKTLCLLSYIFFLCYQFIIFKSVDGFVITLIFGFLFYPFIMIPFSLLVGIFFIFSDNVLVPNRLIQFLTSLKDDYNISILLQSINDASGFRLSSIQSSINYGFNNLLGGGVGLWPLSSMEAYNEGYFHSSNTQYFKYHFNGEFSPARPASYIANIFLDFGLIGFFVFFMSLNYSIRNFITLYKLKFYLIFLISLFFISSVGNPLYWISFAIILRYKKVMDR